MTEYKKLGPGGGGLGFFAFGFFFVVVVVVVWFSVLFLVLLFSNFCMLSCYLESFVVS